MNEFLKERLGERLAQHHEIRFAVLYGSAVTGNQFRDLDIGVFIDRGQVGSEQDWDFAIKLTLELERQVDYPVDVRVINDTSLPFRYNVSRGTPLFLNDREAWFLFLERTWIEYLDFQPVAMQYLREMA